MIEQLKEDLVDDAFRLMKQNMQSYYEERNGPWNEKKIRANFLPHNGIVLKRAATLIALSFYEVNDRTIHIHTLQISPGYQNRNIGGQFFKWYLKYASENEIEVQTYRVFENNPAFKLYRRIGFEVVANNDGLIDLSLDLQSR